jgi:hypothetical protein
MVQSDHIKQCLILLLQLMISGIIQITLSLYRKLILILVYNLKFFAFLLIRIFWWWGCEIFLSNIPIQKMRFFGKIIFLFNKLQTKKFVHWRPLNVITLGPSWIDNINKVTNKRLIWVNLISFNKCYQWSY